MTLIMVVSLTACGSSGDGSQSSGSGGKETLVVVTWGGELETALKKAAEGFEEGKSLLTIDILRRAGIARVSSIKDREINGCDGISAIAL